MRTISFAPNPDFTGYLYTSHHQLPLPLQRQLIRTYYQRQKGYLILQTYSSQNFRIIRRIPTEFYILAKNKPGAYTGEGLLLPENFDPQYDAREVAIRVGAISRTN